MRRDITMTDDIVNSIFKTTKHLNEIVILPAKQGIYGFFVDKSLDLGKFGSPGQIIYVGLSEKNLNSRDTGTHLATGQTGWSTLRRSIGAILKLHLNLTAQKRDKNSTKLRADKYKFSEEGESLLTEWMSKNLKMGYWATDNPVTLVKLRKEEENVILKLKPTLDLDKRTRQFNPLWRELDHLRKICREEVKQNNI